MVLILGATVGMILLVVGAGAFFGAVLRATGVGETVAAYRAEGALRGATASDESYRAAAEA